MKTLFFILIGTVLALLSNKFYGTELWKEPLAVGFFWYLCGLGTVMDFMGND